jgi:hypothetical protein
MIPDHVMVKRIKSYDPQLFVKWNPKPNCHYWEIWRQCAVGNRLITPVTQSIYDEHAKIEYAPLDNRILWWLSEADTWKKKDRSWVQESNREYVECVKKMKEAQRRDYNAFAREAFNATHNFYAHKAVPKKQDKAFNQHNQHTGWIRPDVKSQVSDRMFYRSKENALQYGYKK